MSRGYGWVQRQILVELEQASPLLLDVLAQRVFDLPAPAPSNTSAWVSTHRALNRLEADGRISIENVVRATKSQLWLPWRSGPPCKSRSVNGCRWCEDATSRWGSVPVPHEHLKELEAEYSPRGYTRIDGDELHIAGCDRHFSDVHQLRVRRLLETDRRRRQVRLGGGA